MQLLKASLYVFLLASTFATANAQSDSAGNAVPVFQIGTFDRSATEFSQSKPNSPVIFLAGPNTSAKSWYASQPVDSSSSESTSKENIAAAPRTIKFNIPETPAATYHLHVALLIESLSVPALRVGINGKSGTFYLDSELESHLGGMDDSAESRLASADVELSFPGTYLQKGTNFISLQTVQSSDDIVPNAGLTYDAIELDATPSDAISKEPSAQIVPTIYYRQDHGKLVELVNVFIRSIEQTTKADSADLTIDGKTYHQTFSPSQDFGEQKLEFAIPDFPANTSAHLSWTIAGHRQQIDKAIDPGKKWTLFIVPHIHLDIGYSDYQAKVAEIQSRAIDEAMDLTARYPGFKFSVDGSWNLEQFMKTRSPADRQRAIAAIQKQELFVPAQYANLLTGLPTAETLIRSLYASANFSRIHGTPFNYANLTDVPTSSWAYASILASAGIKYYVAGPNGAEWRAPVLLRGHLNEKSPFWWAGPDGKKVLFWYARHYQEMDVMFGLPPSIAAGHQTLPLFFKAYENANYRANAAILYGTQVENTDLFPEQAELAAKWNAVYAYPKLQYSGFQEALQQIQQQFGDHIPTVTGDGGAYWEDGIASDARYAAIERENESRGPSAEKLATLSSLVNPRVAVDKPSLDRMWDDMVMMEEHTWTAHNSFVDSDAEQVVQQLAVKDQYAINAHALADWLLHSSMASLVDSIAVDRNSLTVFNTLNWNRSGSVDVDLNNGNEIVDPQTNQPVSMEVLSVSGDLRRVRFVAQDVPATGYKIYKLQHAAARIPTPETSQSTTMESPYYRVELDPASGAIRSIYDKELHRELVDQASPYRLGQYLYVSGGDQRPNSILIYHSTPLDPKLTVHPAHEGHLISVTRTPQGWIARLESTDTNTPRISTEIRLFDKEKKIELVESVNKTEVHTREAAYFAFPFNMDHPQFQYEIPNGVVNPAKDMYPGADLEWFSVQHWVSVEQNGVSATVMPLDAPLVTLGDINRGAWPASFGDSQGSIFSYIMNNYWNTNYQGGQGGQFTFRYGITSAATTNATDLSRKGWEEMTPLERDEVTTQDKAIDRPEPLPPLQDSLLNVDDPALLLEDWKPAEDGNGTILRFLDLGGAHRTVTVNVPLLQLTQATQTDAVERDQYALHRNGSHGFDFIIDPHEIVTVRVIGNMDPKFLKQWYP